MAPFTAERTARLIPDGNLTRSRGEMETTRWIGFKIADDWTWTDPSGHEHATATLRETTYQPTEDVYCEEHGEVETRSVGDRRCRQCDVEVKPKGRHGEHVTSLPLPYTWSVEYIGRGVRHRWVNVPDALGIEIFEARAIHPFLGRLVEEVGEAVESEDGTML